MSRHAWFWVGFWSGAILEHIGTEMRKRTLAEVSAPSFTQADIDRAYEQGEQTGQRMGRLNERMGAP